MAKGNHLLTSIGEEAFELIAALLVMVMVERTYGQQGLGIYAYLVFTKIGPGSLLEDNGIIPKAEPALKETLGKLTTEEAQLKKIIQEGRVAVDVEMEEIQAYVTRKLAEKDLYVRTKKAEANLLVKLAEAEKVRLKNEALKGVGSERMVGLKMADVYQGLNLIILPSDGRAGVNPLDLDNALKLFDVRKGGAR